MDFTFTINLDAPFEKFTFLYTAYVFDCPKFTDFPPGVTITFALLSYNVSASTRSYGLTTPLIGVVPGSTGVVPGSTVPWPATAFQYSIVNCLSLDAIIILCFPVIEVPRSTVSTENCCFFI